MEPRREASRSGRCEAEAVEADGECGWQARGLRKCLRMWLLNNTLRDDQDILEAEVRLLPSLSRSAPCLRCCESLAWRDEIDEDDEGSSLSGQTPLPMSIGRAFTSSKATRSGRDDGSDDA
eukprot:3911193-Rhodomonas_salina.2